MANEEIIIKRIVKCYLYHQKEATATTLVKHIEETDYGIKKMIQPKRLTRLIKKWMVTNRDWFNIGHYVNKYGATVFYYKGGRK